MHRFLCVWFAALIVLPLLARADNDTSGGPVKRQDPAAAKRGDTGKSPRAEANSKKNVPAITAQQEAAATALVREHHNDLFELLIYLKEGMPREYDRAIRDLSRASDRLALFEKRDPKRYRLELRLWQAQSRRQLLTARLQMGHDEALLKQLRETLREEHELGLDVLRHERERFNARVAKIDEQIKTQTAEAEALVEKKFATLTKAAKGSQRNVSSKSRKPANKKKTKDPT